MTQLKSNLQLEPTPLAQGYFGKVFRGKDDIHGRVAVKVPQQLSSETDADWQVRRKELLSEGRNLSKATHTNVVRVFYLVESDIGDLHLAMEYCEGGSLQAAFDKGPMRLDAVRKITTEVAFGLGALHARGMLHRDIKPGNILLDRKGTAKLGDFGLVTDNIILGYGSQAGYSDHLAPEIWSGSGTSVKTDIWALGMTVYRLLHGAEWCSRRPSPQTIVVDGGFADTLVWLPHIPKRWRRFVRKMLEDHPHARYQDAGQLLRGLAELPIEPKWACSVTGAETRWKARINARRVNVVWTRHSKRSHEWEAWSEPIGAGNRRSLDGSPKSVGYNEADWQLKKFFASYS